MYIRLLFLLYRIYTFLVRPVGTGGRDMLIQDGQALLVRHTYLAGWYMPGGGIKRGETTEEAARREAAEETGAELGAVRLLGVYSNFEMNRSDHNVVFLCTDFKWNRTHDSEIAEARFFPLTSLPADLQPGHRRRIEEVAAGATSPAFGRW
jgi:8-oxo-dGTP pyrophosphatase MutT (NUDIX family)